MTPSDSAEPRVRVDLPEQVTACIRRVAATGAPALLVGGAVRDALQGRRSRDFDVATSLEPVALRGLFDEVAEFDPRLGACHVRVAGHEVVFTTFREEGDYRDHRHPGRVRFVDDPLVDAARRDFTVNAIYADPETGRLLDPCGGLEDLRRGRLRAIGDPGVRFREDALRMLRAARFAAHAGLEIEPRTRAALAENSPLLRALSAERTFAELTTTFTRAGRGRALRLLVECGPAAVVLPELVALRGVPQPPEYHPEGDVLTHTCLVLDRVTEDDPVQAWAAVLHDTGKPATFERARDRIRFHGHDKLSAEIADAVLRRLRAPGELREVVVEICRQHIRFASLPEMSRGKRERWMRSRRFPAHLEFHRADCAGSHGDLSLYETARASWQALPPEPPPPPCTGRDVLALGVPEGPMVGEILRALQSELDRIEDPDRDTALALLERIARSRVKQGTPEADKP